MNIIKTTIEGLVIIEPKVYQDERGYFFESFNANEFAEKTGYGHGRCGKGSIQQ